MPEQKRQPQCQSEWLLTLGVFTIDGFILAMQMWIDDEEGILNGKTGVN